MAEILMPTETGEAGKDYRILRFHHLEYISAIALTYTDEEVGRLGDNFGPIGLDGILEFSRSFNAQMNAYNLEDLSRNSRLGILGMSKSRYLKDVMGDTPAENALFFGKRENFVAGFFADKINNLGLITFLTDGEDGICKSCVVGRHCKTKYPKIIRPIAEDDIVVKNSLISLSRRKFSGTRRYENKIRKSGDGVEISNSLIFEKQFYLDLKSTIKRKYFTLAGFDYWRSLK